MVTKIWEYTAKLLSETLETPAAVTEDPEAYCLAHAGHALEPSSDLFEPGEIALYFQKHVKPGDLFMVVSPYKTYYLSTYTDCDRKQVFILGPFCEYAATDEFIYEIMESQGLKEEHFLELKGYYQVLPVLDSTKAEMIVRGIVEDLVPVKGGETVLYDGAGKKTPPPQMEDGILKARLMEERYSLENSFLDAVSEGSLAKACDFQRQLGKYTGPMMRLRDPIRNRKNLLVIMNTLLRKSAEKGGVHPVYLDHISNEWALRIERTTSLRELERMHGEMVRAYCLLVKNYALSEFTPLVKKTINSIGLNLSGELTVQSLAKDLGVTPDYLSRIFKKETGTAVIEYVNRKRIDASLKLLNATDMQIQDIASFVGIGDVSYFGKLFRRFIGMSPGKYRNML